MIISLGCLSVISYFNYFDFVYLLFHDRSQFKVLTVDFSPVIRPSSWMTIYIQVKGCSSLKLQLTINGIMLFLYMYKGQPTICVLFSGDYIWLAKWYWCSARGGRRPWALELSCLPVTRAGARAQLTSWGCPVSGPVPVAAMVMPQHAISECTIARGTGEGCRIGEDAKYCPPPPPTPTSGRHILQW